MEHLCQTLSHIISFHPHTSLLRKELLLSQFCVTGNRSLMRLSNLSTITQWTHISSRTEPCIVRDLSNLPVLSLSFVHCGTLPMTLLWFSVGPEQMKQFSKHSGSISLHTFILCCVLNPLNIRTWSYLFYSLPPHKTPGSQHSILHMFVFTTCLLNEIMGVLLRGSVWQ